MDLDKLGYIKAKLEKARITKIRAEANLDEAMARLTDMGFESVEDAEKALEDMAQQKEALESELETKFAEIERKYPELTEDFE